MKVIEKCQQLLDGIHIENLVRKNIKIEDDLLLFGGVKVDLNLFDRIQILGVGKSACPFIKVLLEKLSKHEDKVLKPLALTKHHHGEFPSEMEIYEGGHPYMDESSFLNGERAIQCIRNLKSDDLLLFCMSGGASAVVEKPYDCLEKDFLKKVCEEIVTAGCNIDEVNSIRSELSELKNGGIVSNSGASTIVSLILCDVPSGKLESIGSGPTTFVERNLEETKRVAKSYLSESLSGQFLDFITSDVRYQVTLDKRKNFLEKKVYNFIIGNDEDLRKVAETVFSDMGELFFVDAVFDGQIEEGVLEHINFLKKFLVKNVVGVLSSLLVS